MPRYLFIDWGTSNLKAYLVDPAERPIQYKGDAGIKGLPRAAIVTTLDRVCAELGVSENEKITTSGMIGSSIGWEEVNYVSCPADAQEIAQSVRDTKIGNRRVGIVPGLAYRNQFGQADVLRGEEIEVLGVLLTMEASGAGATLLLPGTHSKWVKCQNDSIKSFRTFMTGELFDVLAKHSILESTIDGMGIDDEHFEKGVVDGSAETLGLDRLFSVRASGLIAGLRPNHAASYLRGLLIGGEISAMRLSQPEDFDSIQIVAGENVSRLYVRALQTLGIHHSAHDQNEILLRGIDSLMRQMKG